MNHSLTLFLFPERRRASFMKRHSPLFLARSAALTVTYGAYAVIRRHIRYYVDTSRAEVYVYAIARAYLSLQPVDRESLEARV